jgi:hypothetical protein
VAVALCGVRRGVGRRSSLAESARANVDAKLQAITPEQDQAILEEAGFRDGAVLRGVHVAGMGRICVALRAAVRGG